MAVEQVSKTRFKVRVLAYLRKVQETGQPVVILDRGRPVVKVVPYRSEAEGILRILRGVGSTLRRTHQTGGRGGLGDPQVTMLDAHVRRICGDDPLSPTPRVSCGPGSS